jgi:hypothetical protein
MELFKDRLKDRTLDVLDWVDYRPDPHWWQYLAVPVVLGAAYWITPLNMLPFLVIATIGIAAFALVFMLVSLLACVAWRAIKDVIDAMKRKRQPTWQPTQPLVRRFN